MPKAKKSSSQLAINNQQLAIILISLITLISLTLNIVFIVQNRERNRVARVVDGDSFDLSDGRRIRLLGLDAPERGECRGQEAYEKLKNLAQGRHIRLKNIVTDDYGRLLANVIIEDLDTWLDYLFNHKDTFVNKIMVAEGLARFNSVNTPYKEILKKAQEKAKVAKLAIWSETCRSEKPTTQCVIKANIRAGKKTYFLPDCSNYSDVIIDLSFGDRWFCSEEDASSSGFSKAPGC